MKKFSRGIYGALVIYLAAVLMSDPQTALKSGKDALLICANSVVPALFPYLVCSGFLSRAGLTAAFSRYMSPLMRPVFGVPGSGAVAFVLGMVSGYPVGAVCVNDLYQAGECSKEEAERMLAFCNNSGPLFILSVVGCGFLGSPYLGRVLYISHILAAVLTGITLKTFSPHKKAATKALPPKPATAPKSIIGIVGTTMDSSVFSIAKICGFVIFFTVFAKALPQSSATPYIHSWLEITGGIKSLCETSLNTEIKLGLISFFLAFSGVSVMLQVGAVTVDSGLSLKTYFWGKLCQGTFSVVLTKILVSYIPIATDTATKNAVSEIFKIPHSVFQSSLIMLIFALCVLFSMLGLFRLIKNTQH